jgi:hypothetical protein
MCRDSREKNGDCDNELGTNHQGGGSHVESGNEDWVEDALIKSH